MQKISIIGSGTAGLVSALLLRKAFPKIDITIVSSSKIGIIGVGEGSTEHWKVFMDACDIPIVELLNETKATHKNGIRFENWTNHTPDYFHSVTTTSTSSIFNFYTLYNELIRQQKTLSENLIFRGVIENKVRANSPHTSVNQYHFDTFKLNEYLTFLCKNRNIVFIDSEVKNVNLNTENGNIKSIDISNQTTLESDFWIDASGLSRILISKLKDNNWNSFKEYLQMDSAIAFPTESDPSGQIRPYTRARAMKNGWVWEIPTQERRGNGYVFSSRHCTEDQAVQEVSELLGIQVEPARVIRFDPGALKEMWIKNCVAVGLSAAFVEPIEATSIGGTIQQIRCLIEYLCAYTENSKKMQIEYNKKMSIMMENILSVISLHYMSDRRDSQMWIDQSMMKKPDYLINLLELWTERPPFFNDISYSNYEMFLVPHFYHIGQGQGIFNPNPSSIAISRFGFEEIAKHAYYDAKLQQTESAGIDHAESLRQIQI